MARGGEPTALPSGYLVRWRIARQPASRRALTAAPGHPDTMSRTCPVTAGSSLSATGEASELPATSRAPRAGHAAAVDSSAHPRVREAGQVSPARAGPQVSGRRTAASPRCAWSSSGWSTHLAGMASEGEDDSAVPAPPQQGPARSAGPAGQRLDRLDQPVSGTPAAGRVPEVSKAPIRRVTPSSPAPSPGRGSRLAARLRRHLGEGETENHRVDHAPVVVRAQVEPQPSHIELPAVHL